MDELWDAIYRLAAWICSSQETFVACAAPLPLPSLRRCRQRAPCRARVCCAGAGELHLEICLNDLQQEYMGGAAINVSDPVVSYRECVTDRSDHTVMAKSPNKHNRIYLEGRPLEEGLAEKIDEGDIGPQVRPTCYCPCGSRRVLHIDWPAVMLQHPEPLMVW